MPTGVGEPVEATPTATPTGADAPDSSSPIPNADLGMGTEGVGHLWGATPTQLEKRPSYDEAIAGGDSPEPPSEEEEEEYTFEYTHDKDPFPVRLATPTSGKPLHLLHATVHR